jgi:hypothetical protein
VNLHAGWVLLFLFGGAVIVGEAIDRLLRRNIDPGPLSWTELGWLALMLAASGVALVANPNGVAIYGYPGYTVGIGALSDFVGEWQSASLSNLFGWMLLGFVVLGALPTLVLAQRRIRSSDALMLVGVITMSVIAVRFLLITGPIGAAIVAVYLSPALAATSAGSRWSTVLQRLDRSAQGITAAVSIGLVAVLVLGGLSLAFARAMPASQEAEIAREFPAGAVEWMRAHDVGSRGFNLYEWGGYLGLTLPGEPIFIDGRADVFGDQVIRDYVSIIGLAQPQAMLDRYGVDHVITRPDDALARWLDSSHAWVRRYADNRSGIWVRASG